MTPPTRGDASSPQLPDGLGAVLEEACDLLEAQNHADFLRRFGHPSELEGVLAGRSFERLATSFGRSKANDMLNAIRHLQESSVVEIEGETVILSSHEREGRILLERVDGSWFFRNEGSEAPPRRQAREGETS